MWKTALCLYFGAISPQVLAWQRQLFRPSVSPAIVRSLSLDTVSPVTALEELFQNFTESASSFLQGSPRADNIIKEVFGSGTVDATVVASACSHDVEYYDLCLKTPLVGPEAVKSHLEKKFPPETRFLVSKIADGKESSGFTWMYQGDLYAEEPGKGLRGTTYLEIDASTGKIIYIKEACEPLFKPGSATADLLKAITADAAKELELNGKPDPTYVEATPSAASDVVEYLWKEAYPKGAETSEALRLFADNIVYEDFSKFPFCALSADEV